DARPGPDGDQPGLQLAHRGAGPLGGQLLRRGPPLPLGRDPLALVGTDHADLAGLGVLDGAVAADGHGHRSPPSRSMVPSTMVVTSPAAQISPSSSLMWILPVRPRAAPCAAT